MLEAVTQEKRHRLLLVLDEFPQLGAMPFFETAMGAMAGYGLKAYLVCQSLNHIIRAYGRDNVIIDNCHLVTAFAASDNETAKRIADMTGEVWELRETETYKKPKAWFGGHSGSITIREERRPLMLAGDVRSLPRDEQLIFAAGAKPIRAKKLKFDAERLFTARLRPYSRKNIQLTTSHDWQNIEALGRLAVEKKPAVRSERPKPKPTLTPAPKPAPTAQRDLFDAQKSISEQALAGFNRPAQTSSHAAPSNPAAPTQGSATTAEPASPPPAPRRARPTGV